MQPETHPSSGASVAGSNPAPSPPYRKRRLAALAGGVVFIVLGIAGYLWYTAPSPPEVALEGVDPAIVTAIEAAQARVWWRPWSGAAWGRLGSVLYMHDFNAEANQCFAEAERLAPREPRWPYLHGRSLAEHDPDAAVPLLQRAVDLTSDAAAAPRLQLAEMLLERGRLDEAESHLRPVLELDSQDARACLGMGRVALAKGRLEESQDFLKRSIAAAPTIKASRVLLAGVYRQRGDKEAADRELRLAAGLPEFPTWNDPFLGEAMALRTGREADLKRARRLRDEGNIAEEIRLLERLVDAYPDSYQGWELLGTAYDNQGDLPAAQKALRTAVQLAPGSVVAQVQLGVALYHQGKYREARSCFREAARLKPDLAAAAFNLGLCLTKEGDAPAAIEAFRQAIHLKPDLAAAYVELGEILLLEGRAAEAIEPLRQAVTLDSNDPRLNELLERAQGDKARKRP